MADEIMKAYKGFHEDMTCRGFQYEEGKEYHQNQAKCCSSGFHACQHPLDCFAYYPPNSSVYHEVELSGDIDTKNKSDSKVSATDIKIGKKLDIASLVKFAIEFVLEKADKENGATGDCGASAATGDYGASTATGNYGASSATGYRGASTATGDYGASTATGAYGASSATGNYGASSATGYRGASTATGTGGASTATGHRGASTATGAHSASTATGDYGASAATGDCGASAATGDYGASTATGVGGASSATGKGGASSATGYSGSSEAGNSSAVAIAWGRESKARGVIGAHLVVAEWELNSDGTWSLKGAKMVQVDGETIKADTWYTMRNGEFVEAEE